MSNMFLAKIRRHVGFLHFQILFSFESNTIGIYRNSYQCLVTFLAKGDTILVKSWTFVVNTQIACLIMMTSFNRDDT